MVQDATSRLRRSRPHFEKCERSMIRRLHGSEGSDATRFPLHIEAADEAADQATADEFRELLERARGRATSATDEVSALSMALAAAQTGALVHQQTPVMRREAPVSDLPKEASEEGEEHLVDHEGSPNLTADAAQSKEALVQEESVSTDAEIVEQGLEENNQPVIPEDSGEGEGKLELLDTTLWKVQSEGEEEAGAQEEVLLEEPLLQPEVSQEVVTNEKTTQKADVELTQKPFEVEVAPRAEITQVARPELAPEKPAEAEGESAPIQLEGSLEQSQWKPTNAASDLPQASGALPKEVALNRAGDMSIQLAILRQAFESARGSVSSQSDATPKRGMSAGQAVGAASEARNTSSDMREKAAKPLTRVQVYRMLEKVETAMKEAARSRDGKTIRFRVEPFDVGEVKVDVSLREGLLHARLKAENQQVTAVLRDKAHELQGALRKLGLDVDNVTVTVSEEGDARTATGEQNLSDGKTFQDERNNMPNEGRQVVENTFGNKLADVSEAGLSRVTNAILDHWVA